MAVESRIQTIREKEHPLVAVSVTIGTHEEGTTERRTPTQKSGGIQPGLDWSKFPSGAQFGVTSRDPYRPGHGDHPSLEVYPLEIEVVVTESQSTTIIAGEGALRENHLGGRDTTTSCGALTTGRKGKAREGSNGAESEGQGWARCPSKSKGKSKRSGKSKSEGKGGSKRQSEAEGTGPGSRSPEAPCSTPRRAEGSATLGLRPHSKRRRSHCGRTPEGEADRRGGGALLPQGVQGSGERCHSVPRGRSGDFEAASYGHHRRGATEVAEWNSRIGAPLDTLWRGVQPRGDSRGPHPRCEDPEEKERRGRGALGGQPGKSVPPGEGGRAIVPESSSEGARPEESSRCCSGGRESRKEKEKGERKGEEKEEAKKGEGGSQEEEYVERKFLIGEASPGWNSSKGGVTEDCEKPVPGNGLGSGRTGPTEGGAPGQTLCAQKRKAKFFRLRLIQRELKRRKTGGRGGHRLPAGGKGAGHCRGVSRRLGTSSPEPDEVQPHAAPWRGRQRRSLSAGSRAILPASAAEKSWRSHGERAVEPLCGSRLAGQRQTSSSAGPDSSTGQECRINTRRHSLDSLPETRGLAGRAGHYHGDLGAEGGAKSGSRRGQNEVVGHLAGYPLLPEPEGRRKGQTRKRRRRQERRKESELKGRWQAKRRGCRKGHLKKRSEELKKKTGGISPGGDSKSGLGSPGPANLEGEQTGERSYKGGSALAPLPEEKEPSHQGRVAGENPYQALVQSMLEATPPFEGATGPNGLGHSPVAADEMFDGGRRGVKKGFRQLSWGGCFLRDCGFYLFEELLEVLPLRSQNMGKRDSTAIFPLPTSRSLILEFFPDLSECELSWLTCAVVSLNSLWGDLVVNETPLNEGQQACLRELVKDVKRFVKIGVIIPELSWTDLFSVRSIDYKGDEVKVAKWFAWKNVEPALPKDVGSVPLEAVCSLGCRDYVENFDLYLRPKSEWKVSKAPRVMVHDDDWAQVCHGLVSSGVCDFILEDDVFHTDSGPLLNGMFGVSKDETTAQGTDIYRLIMNLIPLNGLCKPLAGDIDTLPSWSAMSPFFLQPNEGLLVSSEDVKCFFYTMSVPSCWRRFLSFNKLVPDAVLPGHLQGSRVYLTSCVLPMGFLNSVSLAQHVHRNLVKWSASDENADEEGANNPEGELRKDHGFTCHNPSWRIYLGNYDLLEKVKLCEVNDLEGTCPNGILSLRNEYERWTVPRNLKKAVQRSSLCELQGATVDGTLGVAYPREQKLAKYFGLAVRLCQQTTATQRQWQVVCGGLVYFSMFRRPLLGALNQVWQHILDFDRKQKVSLPTPEDCRLEIYRFLGMLPLARLDFRLDVNAMVTGSDASSSGGGICASTGLTSVGGMVANGALRGEVPEPAGDMAVFSLGLFDGIGALRVALETINVRVLGHVSVECNKAAQRVVEAHYPGVEVVDSVTDIDQDMVDKWAGRYSQCSLVVIGAGPPCQGVSGLNPDRRGALKDERSSLFSEVPRIREIVRKAFRWCPVHTIMESVASMDDHDRDTMSHGYGGEPLRCDAGTFTWCHRPRLYWLSWELQTGQDVFIDQSGKIATLHLSGSQPLNEVVRSGWHKVDDSQAFPTFTTSRPRERPGRKPAGVHQCSIEELERWHRDSFRFPPYQYRRSHALINGAGDLKTP